MTALRALQRYARPAPRAHGGERCELCGTPVGEAHAHVVDLERRGLCCACRACALLFVQPGAANGRYRTVPERVLFQEGAGLTEAQWTALGVPVRLAFFFLNSSLGRTVALYPGPAGATEAEVPAEAWAQLARERPLAAALQPDVEALLAWGRRGSTEAECFLVPVDACYALVARLRRTWRGFDGGDEAHRQLEAFFVELRQRARPLSPAATGGAP